jgi:PEP-CTERM motif
MKKRLGYGLALALSILFTSSAMAGPVITFDENGKVTGATFLGLLPDPLSGIVTVTYGVAGVSGDLLLIEPTGDQSDLLRFIGGEVFVFSDFEPGEPNPALADVGLPPTFQTNLLIMTETGLNGNPYTEDQNGIVYTPMAGQPGDMGNGVTYVFISDAIPEPASIVMMGTGVAIVSAFWRWRRGRRAA